MVPSRLFLAVLVAAITSVSVAAIAFAQAQPANHRARQGTLTGWIFQGGGPPTPHPASIAGEVSVFTKDGRVVARRRVRAGDRFRFRLAPGRYWLNAGEHLRYKWPLGCAPVKVRVKPGQTAKADVFTGCGIP